jgi:hypothetical protein
MENKLTKIDGQLYSTTRIRADILEQELRVPVGEEYYGSADPIPYRWKDDGDDVFEVYHNGSWKEAQSIDFEF